MCAVVMSPSSKGGDKVSATAEWSRNLGRSTWTVLHSLPYGFRPGREREDGRAYLAVARGVLEMYPCGACRDGLLTGGLGETWLARLARAVEEEPDHRLRDAVCEWCSRFHCAVDARQSRPRSVFSGEVSTGDQLRAMLRARWADPAGVCGPARDAP